MSIFSDFLSSLKITNGKLNRPALLLALAKTIREGSYSANFIYPTDEELISNYDIFWRMLGESGDSKFHYPFFALGKSNFWKLIPNPGFEEYLSKTDSLRSFKDLKNSIQAVEIDSTLFNLLRDPFTNRQFVNEVYQNYIGKRPLDESMFEVERKKRLSVSYARLLLPESEFIARMVVKESKTENIYIRDADFQRIIPTLYNYRCSITKQGLMYGGFRSVEACHIEPFSKRHLCTLYNGISLSPEFHKLFDQHFLTIDEHYRVVMSSQINDVSEKPYYKQFHGQKILLPNDKDCWPKQELLSDHRMKFVG